MLKPFAVAVLAIAMPVGLAQAKAKHVHQTKHVAEQCDPNVRGRQTGNCDVRLWYGRKRPSVHVSGRPMVPTLDMRARNETTIIVLARSMIS